MPDSQPNLPSHPPPLPVTRVICEVAWIVSVVRIEGPDEDPAALGANPAKSTQQHWRPLRVLEHAEVVAEEYDGVESSEIARVGYRSKIDKPCVFDAPSAADLNRAWRNVDRHDLAGALLEMERNPARAAAGVQNAAAHVSQCLPLMGSPSTEWPEIKFAREQLDEPVVSLFDLGRSAYLQLLDKEHPQGIADPRHLRQPTTSRSLARVIFPNTGAGDTQGYETDVSLGGKSIGRN